MATPARPLRLALPLLLAVLAAACTAEGGKPSEVDVGASTLIDAEADQLETAPLSLTADDGTSLPLTAMYAKVGLEDRLASTQLTLTFHNPESRTRGGRFAITLPTGAAVSRFAMLIDGEWQEAEVAKRQAGNEFSALVFPIPPRADTQLEIAFSQERRSSRQPYQLLLAGLPRMNELGVEVAVIAPGPATRGCFGPGLPAQHWSNHARDFAPHADLEVRFEREVIEVGLGSDGVVVGRLAPMPMSDQEPIAGLTILFDTSASPPAWLDRQVDYLADLLASMSAEADFPIEIIAFDQDSESIFRGSAREFGDDAKAKLRTRHAPGASDLSGALTRLTKSKQGKLQPRLLVVSDSVRTGPRDLPSLRAAVQTLGKRGVERIDALVGGEIENDRALAGLTWAGLARDGVVVIMRERASVDLVEG
jgi:hypothetical protein